MKTIISIPTKELELYTFNDKTDKFEFVDIVELGDSNG